MASNTVIQTNVLALNAHRNLGAVGLKKEQSSQKLSSGYRINTAADDAAGLAISEKMRSQIRGLDMAAKNSQDAISLIQTAEGGMKEIGEMIQRIRELVDQAANDSNEEDGSGIGDRQKIQDEIEQLVNEIDSMTSRVEFNKKVLLNGAFQDVNVSDLAPVTNTNKPEVGGTPSTPGVEFDKYEKAQVKIAALLAGEDFAKLVADGADASTGNLIAKITDIFADVEGASDAMWAEVIDESDATTLAGLALNANGGSGNVDTEVANLAAALKAIYEELGGSSAPAGDDSLEGFIGTTTGDKDDYVSTSLGAALASAAATNELNTLIAAIGTEWDDILAATTEDQLNQAWDAFVTAGKTAGGDDTLWNAFLADTSGDASAVQQMLADKLALVKYADTDTSDTPEKPAVPGASLQVPKNSLYFQVGANQYQFITVNINAVNSKALGLTDAAGKCLINVVQDSGIDITGYIEGLDKALSFVSTERSKLGAVQNRLEYTINSLQASSENLSASESRIRDTDMGLEMMKLTKANILQQASISMLAQANQQPQSILQLLQ